MSVFKNQEMFWDNLFDEEDSLSLFPYFKTTGRVSLNNDGNHETYIYRSLSPDVSKRIMTMANHSEMAIYLILLAGVSCLLHKYTDQKSLVLGIPTITSQKKTSSINKLIVCKQTFHKQSTFKTVFEQTKAVVNDSLKNQDLPFRKIVRQLNIHYDDHHRPLIHTVVSLNEIHSMEWREEVVTDAWFHFDLKNQAVNLKLFYNDNQYDKDYMDQIVMHLNQLLSVILFQPQTEIQTADILLEGEKNKLLFEFSDTAAHFAGSSTVYQLFEEQVRKSPDHPAIKFTQQHLTYRQLDEKSNQLARTLRENGVRADEPVGIMADRSLEMAVAMIAVWKAGGAYVPLDPEYPEERIQYMLQDANIRVLLLQEHLRHKLTFNGQLIFLNDERSYHSDSSLLSPAAGSSNLAYIIYTSGTTGKPKGVMVEHGAIVNSLQWKKSFFKLSEDDRVLVLYPYVFDAFILNFFSPLISGATLHLLNNTDSKDPIVVKKIISRERITGFATSPRLLRLVIENMEKKDLIHVKHIVVGGEQLETDIVERLFSLNSHILLNNEYGPTENSVVSTYLPIRSPDQPITIGKPVSNHLVCIIGEQNQLQPIGVPGELCVGGAGLARGYLNRPGLTAEKFVDNPFVPGTRMYRTGDLARWLPDGNIEYLGRIDHQVKIRGFRIELGEVEAALLNLELVREAAVIAQDSKDGSKQLYAYYVGDPSFTAQQFRERLSRELPDYMVPSSFIHLEQMPLTTNGKIDLKALPVPDGKAQENKYAAPKTAAEKLLVSIWQEVLGVERIGILDNFFDLGGDSIKSIQVSSRLYQTGYKIDMKHLFKYPTIAGLSPYVELISRLAEQGEIKGRASLTPIQHWFFEQHMPESHHYNQAVLLYSEHGFNESSLRKVMSKIVQHHDALRMIFKQTPNGYEAWQSGIEESELFHLEILDYKNESYPAEAVEHKANEIQSSIDLSKGPLMKLGLFRCADGDHLLIVIHHLVVDGVSWRILLEDFVSGYEQAENGETIQFPPKTDSFRFWSEQLSMYARNTDTKWEQELEYWTDISNIERKPLPKDNDCNVSLLKDSKEITVHLTVEETEQLLKHANRAYNTEINDLLLTSLGLAVHQWTGMQEITVNLEGHGREAIIPDIDISRTVGWFTSQYPVVLKIEKGKELTHYIKTVKEGLRRIPYKGINYGIIRYLSGHPDASCLNANPEISFNYLGQFDQVLQHSALRVSPYSTGLSMNENQPRQSVLDFNGMIAGGRLILTLSYSGRQYRTKTMEQFAGILKASLQNVIRHCVSQEHVSLTPSDILLKDITIEELEQLLEQTREWGEVENIYPLTPMQKGMLFHSLYDSNSGAYFQQTRFDLHGELDVDSFSKSLDEVSQRYDIFRTNFYRGWKDQPLQIIFTNKKIGFTFEDLREMNETEQNDWIRLSAEKDKMRGFDLAKDELMRLTILRTCEARYHVIWSFHHILMDGWCLPLITKEIFEHYTAILQQRPAERPPVTPYSQYIEWLIQQDEAEAGRYWKQVLEGYGEQTVVPADNQSVERENYVLEKVTCELGTDLTKKMKRTANKNHVTLNTLLQTAWGVLLQKYNASQDVVFGSVVSGRPAGIPNVETMIGLFINTIPVRIRCEAGTTFTELMKQTQENAAASQQYETYPLYEIQAQTVQKQQFITHILVFENYPVGEYMESLGDHHGLSLDISNIQMQEQTNYDFNITVIPGENINIYFEYNAEIYERASIERMRGHLLQILNQIVADSDIAVEHLEWLTEDEKGQLLQMFNDTEAPYPQQMVYQLFEAQAERVPDQPAVIGKGEQLTYRQLNERANQLARTLRAKGLQADQLAAIISHPSTELMVGILAVLKAGGAYVPIDPEYPEDRIRYMLEDSRAKIVLTQRDIRQHLINYEGDIVLLDDPSSYHKERSNLVPASGTGNLAYVIYTSGSTGKPKGVLIEHQGLTNYIWWAREVYVKGEKTNFPLYSSISFDLTVTSLFTPLVTGNAIIVYRGEDKTELLADIVKDPRVDIIKLTPAHLHVLKEMNIAAGSTVRKMIVGGEQLSTRLAESISSQFTNGLELFNEYGPTETVVGCMIYQYDAKKDRRQSVPIGKPAANKKLYVLDASGKPVPIGVPGEIYIGGAGTARGYLNRPELTAERFVDNPFERGTKMYRTGDLARWLSDGNMEYLGRMDEQVKIRGYRIELGEIETALHQVEGIKEAVVTAREEESGLKQLCAYYVSEKALSVPLLREQLSRELPGYMVPTYFVTLEQMPLTSNGKIDRRALPAPDSTLYARVEYQAPRTEIETQLASIWESVLGAEQIGIRDNFFDLGGDSIKSIQVSSRLNQLGYKMEIKHLFKYPTIAELSPHISGYSRVSEQGEIKGKVRLTPIQYWFFEQKLTDPHHYNQAVMLYSEPGFHEASLRTALKKISEHHDALRMVFRESEDGYEAWNLEVAQSELYQLEVFNLKDEPAPGPAIEDKAGQIQGSMQLSSGPLLKAGLFQCTEGDHLLIAVHHLVIDGISWRILLEDLVSGYNQAENGEAIQLPDKTDSFQLWAEKLSVYAESSAMEQEQEYWKQVEQADLNPLPKDFHITSTYSKDSETLTVEWTRETTEQLLKQANQAYNTEINDLLLTSLGLAVYNWAGMEEVAVQLEGHGREEIVPDMDISRTIGWFTTQYPVVLHLEPGQELSRYIKTVKERLRQIPNKGIGYGLIRYLGRSKEMVNRHIRPEISFNYLGQFDQDLQHNGLGLSPYSCGTDTSGNQARPYVLNMNGMITNGKLVLEINYSHKQYKRETVERLSGFIQTSLQALVEHCINKRQTELTPSDILLRDVTIQELEELLNQLPHPGEVQNVYPLTPMQKGMLFHNLLESGKGSYFEQASFDLQGDLDFEVFKQSLEQLFQKYDVLRTNFYTGWKDTPLQVVYKKKRVDVQAADLRELNKQQREGYIESYRRQDKARGFDLMHDVLMRISVFRIEDRLYRLIWSFHHILMDGWCLSLFTNEVFNQYLALKERRDTEPTSTAPYSQYIEWLEQQDHEEAKQYWQQYLQGYEGDIHLPLTKAQEGPLEYVYGNVVCQLDKEETRQLQQIANRNQVTLHTLIQTLWGILLQKYNRVQDVVFGSVVSGRPADIPGVEQMIGLFINTIPVRICCDEEISFVDAIKIAQEKALSAQPFDSYPLYEIQAQTVQKQNLMDHIMVFENYPIGQEIQQAGNDKASGLQVINFHMEEHSHYDFSLLVIPHEKLTVHFSFNHNVYVQAEVERIKGHFEQLVRQITTNPKVRVQDLELITRQEKEQMLEGFRAAQIQYPHEKTIHQLFEEQTVQTPDRTAIVFEGEQLTYGELNKRANRLARKLQREGVQAGQIVGIMVERSLEMIVGILGILKAGAAYLPLDPGYPLERIQYILDDSGIRLLLVQGSLYDKEILFSGKWIDVEVTQASDGNDDANLELPSHSSQLAYAIYTSGTTGKPKGTLIEHRQVVHLIEGLRVNIYSAYDSALHVALLAPFYFDASVQQIFASLLLGHTLFIVPREVVSDGAALCHYYRKHRIEVTDGTPSHLKLLIAANKTANNMQDLSLRHLLIGGEALQKTTVSKLLQLFAAHSPEPLITNVYGPTETCVDAALFTIAPSSADLNGDPAYVPIGKPLGNNRIYILDSHRRLLPVGVEGELYIAGDGVGRGYLNLPELTNEKFTDDPFVPTGKMYRTGDLARWLPDGNIEYVGRIDHQVKILGFRIELGEIESAMLSIPAIQEAAVVPFEDETGESYLCGYFAADCIFPLRELKDTLSRYLPGYMIPSYFVQLDKMPLTANGKLDRKGLPAPDGKSYWGTEYAAPQTSTEIQLASIWQEVLGLDQVGIKDNFFDIGGHSLRATALVSKIHKQLNLQLPLREVFQNPTIEQMAQILSGMEQLDETSIPVIEKQEYYPVSSAQKRLYILNHLEGGELSYNMLGLMSVEGQLDAEKLQEAFNQLIQRHESLRTGFKMVEGEPVQFVQDQVEFAVEKHQARADELKEYIHRFVRPFQLEKPPLLRVQLIELQYNESVLLFDMHHIISDGTSMNILIKEFVQLYEGKILPPLRIQYKDYAAWQTGAGRLSRMKKQEAYWLELFSGDIPVLHVPTDFKRPSKRDFTGATLHFIMDRQRSAGLKQLALESGSTLYMVLLAAYTLLLSKYSGQEDIIVGSPIAGRPHADLEPVIGMFVNTLAMRNYPAKEKTFSQYLKEVRENALKAYEHQDYPFEKLVEQLDLTRDLSRNPLFDTMFVLQNTEQQQLAIDGLTFKPYPSEHTMAKFDLTLTAVEQDSSIHFYMEYLTTLFKPETVERMMQHFMRLVDTILEKPEAKLSSLDMITLQEKSRILGMFNNTVSSGSDRSIAQLFEQQAELKPDHTAILFKDRAWTYRELNERANQLARVLRDKGLCSDRVAAILTERSANMIIGILAIVKAGGAFLPIDPELPDERISYLIQDSGADVLLTCTEYLIPPSFEGSVIWLDDPSVYRGESYNLNLASKENDLFYVIYTSGTTGLPKGVELEHKTMLNLITYEFNHTDLRFERVLQFAAMSFDVCYQEIFSTLLSGGTLYIIDNESKREMHKLNQFVRTYGIQTAFLPTAFLKLLASEREYFEAFAECVDHIITAGEQLVVTEMLHEMLVNHHVKLHNHYGPSETHVVTMFTVYPEVYQEIPPIGKPISNTGIFILNEAGSIQPIGIVGELCISGASLARGYHNREALTHEKFVPHPFDPDKRIYKTGDLARYLPDGNIEYLGRIDHQVKIRGYRIELGEVEAALLNVEQVQEAVVMARENEDGQKDLYAYFVADQSLSVSKLKEKLSSHLPGYMIPSYLIQLEQMPLTSNGKVNRQALPLPEGILQTGTDYAAPRTTLEKQLAQLWKEVLKLKQVSIKDNFFDLGGHSLRGMALVSKIHKQLSVNITLREVFQYPTIEEMAKMIAAFETLVQDPIPAVDEKDYYPVSSAQKMIYLSNQIEGGELSYNMPGILQLEGMIDIGHLEAAFHKLIQRHESLRTGFEMIQGEPMQVIKQNVDFSIEMFQAAPEEVDSIFHTFVRAFDLGQAPLLRVGLIELEPDRHILMFDMHHIITDGVSMNIFVEELVQLYDGHELPPLRIQYKDFTMWQQQERQRERIRKQEAYWLDIFAGEIPSFDLPKDFARPYIRSFEGKRLDFILEEPVTEGLKRVEEKTGTTSYMVLLAAYTTLLAKYSGQEDIIVGTPIAGRVHEDLQRVMGMFVNTLAIRTAPAAEKTFIQYLSEMKETMLKAYENQEYPFEQLVEKLNIQRDLSRNPLFDTMFVMQNTEQTEVELDSLTIKPYDQMNTVAKFDLQLTFTMNHHEIQGSFDYCTKLFKKKTIATMAKDFTMILSAVIQNPSIPLKDIQLSEKGNKGKNLVSTIELDF